MTLVGANSRQSSVAITVKHLLPVQRLGAEHIEQWRSFVQVSLSADNDNLAKDSCITCYDTGKKKVLTLATQEPARVPDILPI